MITATEGGDTSTCTVIVIPNYAFPLDGASTQTFSGGATDIEYVTKFISMTQALNVTVDGIELDPINYTMANSSMGTVVTLKSSWLQTQANKSYNIVTHFIQGYSTFTLVVNQPILSSGTSSNSTSSGGTSSGGTSSNDTPSGGTSSGGTFSSATTNSQSAAKNSSSTSQGGGNPTSPPLLPPFLLMTETTIL